MNKKTMVAIVSTPHNQSNMATLIKEWLVENEHYVDVDLVGATYVDQAQFRDLARTLIKASNTDYVGMIVKEDNLHPGSLEDMTALAASLNLPFHVISIEKGRGITTRFRALWSLSAACLLTKV